MKKDYTRRSNEPGIENRARTPTKGLRVRLRKALREAGVTAKFRTDERRNGSLVVLSKEKIVLPFELFERYRVRFVSLEN
ncbi:MAG: hypothetical protein CTY12_00860 [Methylotenera sp.]|nr:MAG: hypothetical protein CTY12_00860 [Methylotenera sp.]